MSGNPPSDSGPRDRPASESTPARSGRGPSDQSDGGGIPYSRPPYDGTGRSILAGVLIGMGVAAFIDETVFHQLLHWHHFYDRSTPAVGLVSDGYFHAAGWLAIVVGLFMYADLHRRQATVPKRVWAGGLLGWGGFQVYDGLFQHKVLGLHQIRYGVEILPYDLVWNLTGALGILVGLFLLRGAPRAIAAR